MEDTLTILLATSVGAGISFTAQYIVEARQSKNDKFKFAYEKLISMGERHYEFTGVALLAFDSVLNKFKNLNEFESPQAHEIYESAIQIMAEHNKAIMDRTHTITSADIYFNISKIEVAQGMIQRFNFEIASMVELSVGNDPQKHIKEKEKIATLIKLIEEYMALIIKDRRVIADRIREIVTTI